LAIGGNGLQLHEVREFEEEINLKNEDSFTIICSFGGVSPHFV